MITSQLQGNGITQALGLHHAKTLTSFQIFAVAAVTHRRDLRESAFGQTGH